MEEFHIKYRCMDTEELHHFKRLNYWQYQRQDGKLFSYPQLSEQYNFESYSRRKNMETVVSPNGFKYRRKKKQAPIPEPLQE